MGIMIALLCIGAGIAMSVMFMNYFAKDKHLPTYKERLQFYLQNYFDEINAAVFRRRGLFWKLGNNCKWIELHIVRLDGLQSILLQKLDEKSNEEGISSDAKTPGIVASAFDNGKNQETERKLLGDNNGNS
jgi:hypothetical protein